MNWDVENRYRTQGYTVICGTDEAGRGCLAGDVFAAAVILPYNLEIPGLNDSKKLSPSRREELYDIITERAMAWAVASASVEEIDNINILNASLLAMQRAVSSLKIPADFVLVDGNISRGFNVDSVALVKGDSLSPSIAAASVLAKMSRDRHCMELHERYPQYNFAKHKGYATREHVEVLRKLGACQVHRRTFLRKISSETVS